MKARVLSATALGLWFVGASLVLVRLDAFFLGERIALGFLLVIALGFVVLAMLGAVSPSLHPKAKYGAFLLITWASMPSLLMTAELGLSLKFRQAWKSDNVAYTTEQRTADIAASNAELQSRRGMPFGPYTVMKPIRSPHFNINSAGFRGPEFAPLPPGWRRLVILGGSTVLGSGVADDQTIPSHLQRRLLDAGVPVQVVNLGMSSWTFEEELFALRHYGRELKPDIVVFYHGGNDYARSIVAEREGTHLSVDDLPRAIGHRLADETELGRLVVRATASLITRPPRNEAAIRRAVAKFLIDHDNAKRTCEALLVVCRFFLQPMAGDKHPQGAIERRLVETQERRFPAYGDGYRRFAETIRREAPEIIDLRSALNGITASVFNDYIHLIGQGNSAIAEAIYQHIAPDVAHFDAGARR